MESFSAHTLEEAKQLAAQHFNISQEMLTIRVKQKARRGFLGIGRRPAIIEAEPITKPVPKVAKHQAGHDSQRSAVKPKSVTHPRAVKQTTSPHKSARPAEKDPQELERERAEANHRRNLQKMRKAAQGCCQYLESILRELGIPATAQVNQLRAQNLTLEIKTTRSSSVIGYHGRQINALEELGTDYLNYQGVHDPGLVLDTAHYRERRKKAIKRLADRCVMEVISTGQAVFLDPMPARERKEMHRLLEDNPKVKTYSHGREPFRSVVVAPSN